MDHLKSVRKHVFEELSTTRLVEGLLSGALDQAHYKRYLVNAYNYAQYSAFVMATGGARCLRTHPELARYLIHHGEEEAGHELWALKDLEDLGVAASDARAQPPVPACSALIGYIHFLAGYENPVSLFGWMYVLEAVGNDLGTTAGEKLLAELGSARTAVRFVAGHGIADTDHTREITEQIDAHVKAPEDRAAVDRAADVVADLYLRMFHEIGEERVQWA